MFTACVQEKMVNLEISSQDSRTIEIMKKLRQAASKLKKKPELIISQQYPQEIVGGRRKLYPKLKEFHRQGKRATMVYDQLIVNGHPYVPIHRAEPLYPIHNPDHDHA